MLTLYCPTCGYNLTGLRDNRCPECGEAFDPTELRRCGGAIKYRMRPAFWSQVIAPAPAMALAVLVVLAAVGNTGGLGGRIAEAFEALAIWPIILTAVGTSIYAGTVGARQTLHLPIRAPSTPGSVVLTILLSLFFLVGQFLILWAGVLIAVLIAAWFHLV